MTGDGRSSTCIPTFTPMRNEPAMAPRLLGYRRYGLGGGVMALAALVLALSLSLPLLHHLHHGGLLEVEECPVSALVSALSLAVLALLGLVLLAPASRDAAGRRPEALEPCAIHLATQGSRAPPRS